MTRISFLTILWSKYMLFLSFVIFLLISVCVYALYGLYQDYSYLKRSSRSFMAFAKQSNNILAKRVNRPLPFHGVKNFNSMTVRGAYNQTQYNLRQSQLYRQDMHVYFWQGALDTFRHQSLSHIIAW